MMGDRELKGQDVNLRKESNIPTFLTAAQRHCGDISHICLKIDLD